MSRGRDHDRLAHLTDLSEFRNAASTEGGEQAGRRMSITNAMDILRDRLLRAIKVRSKYSFEEEILTAPS